MVDSVPSDEFEFQSRGQVHCKGKGLVASFFLDKRLGAQTEYYVDYASEDEDEEGSISVTNMGPTSTTRRKRQSTLQDALHALHSSIAQIEALNSSFSTGMLSGARTRGSINNTMSVISAISEDSEENELSGVDLRT